VAADAVYARGWLSDPAALGAGPFALKTAGAVYAGSAMARSARPDVDRSLGAEDGQPRGFVALLPRQEHGPGWRDLLGRLRGRPGRARLGAAGEAQPAVLKGGEVRAVAGRVDDLRRGSLFVFRPGADLAAPFCEVQHRGAGKVVAFSRDAAVEGSADGRGTTVLQLDPDWIGAASAEAEITMFVEGDAGEIAVQFLQSPNAARGTVVAEEGLEPPTPGL
ncbi:MAG: hypothetical protein JWR86_2734, partial [Enterovirga sp.]|nr:hypothetical protein [Enterovirga sp.]